MSSLGLTKPFAEDGSRKETASKTEEDAEQKTRVTDVQTWGPGGKEPKKTAPSPSFTSEQLRLLGDSWHNIEQRLRQRGKQEMISANLRSLLECKTKIQRIIGISSKDSKTMIKALKELPHRSKISPPTVTKGITLEKLLEDDSSSEVDEPKIKLKSLIGLTTKDGYILQPLVSSFLVTIFVANSQRGIANFPLKFIIQSADPNLSRPTICMLGTDDKNPKILVFIELLEFDNQPAKYRKRHFQTEGLAKEELKISRCFFISDTILAIQSSGINLQLVDLADKSWDKVEPVDDIRIPNNIPKEFALIPFRGGLLSFLQNGSKLIINQYHFKIFKELRKSMENGEPFSKQVYEAKDFFTNTAQSSQVWDQILFSQVVDVSVEFPPVSKSPNVSRAKSQVLILVKKSGETYYKLLDEDPASKLKNLNITVSSPLAVFYCAGTKELAFLCSSTAESANKGLVVSRYQTLFEEGTAKKLGETTFYFRQEKKEQQAEETPKDTDPDHPSTNKDVKFGIVYNQKEPQSLILIYPKLKKGFLSSFDPDMQRDQNQIDVDSDDEKKSDVKNQLTLAEFDLVYDMSPKENRLNGIEISCTIQSLPQRMKQDSGKGKQGNQTNMNDEPEEPQTVFGLYFVFLLKEKSGVETHLLFKVMPNSKNLKSPDKPPELKNGMSALKLTPLEKLNVDRMNNVELLEFTLKKADQLFQEKIAPFLANYPALASLLPGPSILSVNSTAPGTAIPSRIQVPEESPASEEGASRSILSADLYSYPSRAFVRESTPAETFGLEPSAVTSKGQNTPRLNPTPIGSMRQSGIVGGTSSSQMGDPMRKTPNPMDLNTSTTSLNPFIDDLGPDQSVRSLNPFEEPDEPTTPSGTKPPLQTYFPNRHR